MTAPLPPGLQAFDKESPFENSIRQKRLNDKKSFRIIVTIV